MQSLDPPMCSSFDFADTMITGMLAVGSISRSLRHTS